MGVGQGGRIVGPCLADAVSFFAVSFSQVRSLRNCFPVAGGDGERLDTWAMPHTHKPGFQIGLILIH